MLCGNKIVEREEHQDKTQFCVRKGTGRGDMTQNIRVLGGNGATGSWSKALCTDAKAMCCMAIR